MGSGHDKEARRRPLPDKPDSGTHALRGYFTSAPTTHTGVEIRHGRAANLVLRLREVRRPALRGLRRRNHILAAGARGERFRMVRRADFLVAEVPLRRVIRAP